MRDVAAVRRLRPLIIVSAIALVAALAVASLGSGSRVGSTRTLDSATTQSRKLSSRITELEPRRLQAAAISWRGGPIVTSTGETVNVLVSDAFAVELVTPEQWAEFLAKLVHGPELAQLTTYIAPLSEVRAVCGGGALGCYTRNRSLAVGEVLPDGTTPEEVVRHEYGHHIGLYRSNSPWRAIDWGPKHWASAVGVCARVAQGQAFPGNEGSNYSRNPSEAWAETYRLMDERKVGITTATWPIVAPSFYPNEAALVAAERDVVQPWAAETQSSARKAVAKGKTWLVPVSTPLDGSLAITVRLPAGGQHAVSLVAADRKKLVKRAAVVGARERRISATVCGQRSFFVRVTQKGATGAVTVLRSTP